MADSQVRELRLWQGILTYLGVLIVMGGLAAVINARFHVGDRAIMLSGGTVFLVTSIGRPWWLYATVRRIRWFGLIKSDVAMKSVLVVLGIVLVLAGIFAS